MAEAAGRGILRSRGVQVPTWLAVPLTVFTGKDVSSKRESCTAGACFCFELQGATLTLSSTGPLLFSVTVCQFVRLDTGVPCSQHPLLQWWCGYWPAHLI